MVQHADLDHSAVTGAGIPSTIVDAKGDVIAASAADTVGRLAVGSNGQVLTADSAQSLGVKWASPSAGGVSSGTSFPGSPATDDLFYRTDRDLLYFYDGTRWLTTTLYQLHMGSWNGVTSATGQDVYAAISQDYDLWLVDFFASMEHTTSATGNYFTITLYSKDGSTLSSAIAAVNGNGNTNNAQTREKTSINAALATGADVLLCTLTETGTATMFASAAVTYRLIG